MVSLGDDIKSVVVEVGVGFNIEREATILKGEFLDYEENTQMTKPFTFQHFLYVMLFYDTKVVPGDVLCFLVDKRRYLVMSALPELFENEIIKTSAVLYRCNVVGSLLRPSGETETYSYKAKTVWMPIKSNFPALLTDKLYATRLDDESHDFAAIDISGLVLYVPAYVKPIPLDRFVVSGESPYKGAISGELHYKVTSLETHSFDGVSVVYLEEDTRE